MHQTSNKNKFVQIIAAIKKLLDIFKRKRIVKRNEVKTLSQNVIKDDFKFAFFCYNINSKSLKMTIVRWLIRIMITCISF